MLHIMASHGQALLNQEDRERERQIEARNRQVQEKINEAKCEFARLLGEAWGELEPYIVWEWGTPSGVKVECHHPDFGKLTLLKEGSMCYIGSRETSYSYKALGTNEVDKLLAIAYNAQSVRKQKWQALMEKAKQAIAIARQNKATLTVYQDACRAYCIKMMDAYWSPWKAYLIEYNAGDHTDFVMSLDPPTEQPIRAIKDNGKITKMYLGQYITASENPFDVRPGIYGAEPYHQSFTVGGFVINVPPMVTFQHDNPPQRGEVLQAEDHETEGMVRYLAEVEYDISPEELLTRMGYEEP